ncbi:MAG: sigma 54-interacting transcriptional regulator [Fusobacterium varium]|uniref:sigma-54 interaction domain-containing protein n=1 Tax=Fusobacterium varium TaxID=856 RepID=UPI00242F0DDA|nr:sigma 54-interacting transcriptional regulator [Fusobacterium varium]UYI78628.1 MAG: sigma 54-interacting transcriptional regulator [Fusobacterium varium]
MRERDSLKKIWQKIEEIFLKAMKKDKSIEEKYNFIQKEYHEFLNNYFDFKEIADNLFDGIYISDGEGKTLFINEAYTRITGITREEIIGKNVRDILAKGDIYKGAVTLDVIKEKKRINNIGKIVKLNKDVLVTGSPIFDKNGNVELVVINNRDISELKELENKIENLKKTSLKVDEEIKFLRSRQVSNRKLVYKSEKMNSIFTLINTIAPTDVTVLITGESGTGKELIADEIFYKSFRKDKPFIKVNCAAIPNELLEAELFGYEGGAFTDSKKNGKIGMFELANEGTILLDEIGDMPIKLQTKLLRVLQQKEIMRLGGTKSIKLNIRIIASTNQNLKEQIKNGKFREDLFYRLNVVPIDIEPLRKRTEDIPELIFEFLNIFNKKYNKNTRIEKEAVEVLIKYQWPGNIRELENFLERIVVINTTGIITVREIAPMIDADDFFMEVNDYDLKKAVSHLEKRIITKAIREFGSTRKAAKYLGIDQSTVVKKCKVLNIDIFKEKEQE